MAPGRGRGRRWPRCRSACRTPASPCRSIDLVLDATRPGDEELQDLWRRSPVVLGQIFSLDPQTTPQVGHVVGAVAAAPGSARSPDPQRGACPPFAPLSRGYIGNAGTLISAASVAGHLTPGVHADGVVRELPALICHEGRAYPSLALAALWRAAQPDGAATALPDWTWRAGAGLLEPAYLLTSPSLPGIRVPVDAAGNLRVPFRVARVALTSVSAHTGAGRRGAVGDPGRHRGHGRRHRIRHRRRRRHAAGRGGRRRRGARPAAGGPARPPRTLHPPPRRHRPGAGDAAHRRRPVAGGGAAARCAGQAPAHRRRGAGGAVRRRRLLRR